MTRIGPTLIISGEFESQEATIVEGRITGHLKVADAVLTITPKGMVNADVHGVRVLVEGQLNGSCSASERIELTASAKVEGALSANTIVIREGAVFEGGIDMQRRTIASKMAQYRADHQADTPSPGASPNGQGPTPKP